MPKGTLALDLFLSRMCKLCLVIEISYKNSQFGLYKEDMIILHIVDSVQYSLNLVPRELSINYNPESIRENNWLRRIVPPILGDEMFLLTHYTVKKVYDFPVPSRDDTYQTSQSGNNLEIW